MDVDKQKNYATLVISLLGAAKLTAQAFGYSFITDELINEIANFAAMVLTFAGVFMTHNKDNTDGTK